MYDIAPASILLASVLCQSTNDVDISEGSNAVLLAISVGA